jgi:inward rectifier potassium channel
MINFFASSWTIVHPIDEKSPLYGVGKEDLEASDSEFMILIKAFEDTFSQTVHSRTSYKHNEVIWGAKFTTMFKSDKGHTLIYLDKISNYEAVELPVMETKLQEI